MTYRIEQVRLFVRETPPGRMAFALGKQADASPADQHMTSPLAHVHLVLKDDTGATTFGCAADRLSVRWLDKRPGRSKGRKLRELVSLIEFARQVHLDHREFETPFDQWHHCHRAIMSRGRDSGQEDLTSSFASALFERALLDGASRLAGKPLFEMVRDDRLGIKPGAIHPELADAKLADYLPEQPLSKIYIRHTVGLVDPLTDEDLRPEDRVNDGLPETLAEYIRADGLKYFKVKISGDPHADMARLERIWDVLPKTPQTALTLDANEAYTDLNAFARFVETLERDLTGLFQHILAIEQPLPRHLTFDPATAPVVRRIAERKPLMIDEADGTVDAFRRAREIGYAGASHKNCKGVFKSLLNKALIAHDWEAERPGFLSAEDLQNLPVVPLQQDFAAVAMLGLEHCERNGHHYNHGLSMLSPQDKANAVEHHPDLYVRRGDESYLNIRDGAVQCASLQVPGFGVRDEPDWASMTDMRKWVDGQYP